MTDVERVRLDDFNSVPYLGPLEASRRTFAEVTPRAVRWLVDGLIPLGTSTIFAGIGGLGKSTLLMQVAAQVTQEGGSVIVVSYEDTLEEILRPRAEAAGAVLDRMLELVVPVEDGGAIMLPRDVDRLGREMAETGARLVIIDPILAALALDLDAHRDQDVRVVLARLAALAEDHTCAIALVLHLNKTPSRDAYLRISSSTGFYNAARSVVLVVPDPEEPEQHRLVAQVKSNWSRRSAVQRHVLEEIVLDSVDPGTGVRIVTSRMRYVEDAQGVDRDTLLGADRDERVERRDAWLEEALADGDWHDSAGLKKLAASAGINERTLQRAAKDLDVEHESRGFPRSTWWRLPQSRHALSAETVATVDAAQPSRLGAAPEPSRDSRDTRHGDKGDDATALPLPGVDRAVRDAHRAGATVEAIAADFHLDAAVVERFLAEDAA